MQIKTCALHVASALVFASAGCAAETSNDGPAVEEREQAVDQGQARRCPPSDVLYVGDAEDDTVKKFDARTGAFIGDFVTPGEGGLNGVRGIVFSNQRFYASNQNVNQTYAGEILEYSEQGAFLRATPPHTDPNAPFAPQGVVAADHELYVADLGDPDYVIGGGLAPNPLPAQVAVYDEQNGALVRTIRAPFAEHCDAQGNCTQWSPRAVVFGPDGALYVSAMQFRTATDPNTLAGRVYRIDARGHASVYVDGETCGCDLARPQGLVFSPLGRLYVTSFRKNPDDNDKILIFGWFGRYQEKIDLWQVGGKRAYAQALLFGPDVSLYVPISGGDVDVGSVRRYNVLTKRYETLVAAGGPLQQGWFLTFGKTDPATLDYE